MILAHVSATRGEKGDLTQPLPLAAPPPGLAETINSSKDDG